MKSWREEIKELHRQIGLERLTSPCYVDSIKREKLGHINITISSNFVSTLLIKLGSELIIAIVARTIHTRAQPLMRATTNRITHSPPPESTDSLLLTNGLSNRGQYSRISKAGRSFYRYKNMGCAQHLFWSSICAWYTYTYVQLDLAGKYRSGKKFTQNWLSAIG